MIIGCPYGEEQDTGRVKIHVHGYMYGGTFASFIQALICMREGHEKAPERLQIIISVPKSAHA